MKGQREATVTFQLGPYYCGICEIPREAGNVRNIHAVSAYLFFAAKSLKVLPLLLRVTIKHSVEQSAAIIACQALMLRAFLLMTPLVVMQKEGGKPQMQVREEDDVKYLLKKEGRHFKRKALLSSSAVVGISHQNSIFYYWRAFFHGNLGV